MDFPDHLSPPPNLPTSPENLSLGFEQELLTDWIPDAIGGVDAKQLCLRLRSLEDIDPPTLNLTVDNLRLPLRNRQEITPIIDCVSRATFHCVLELSLTEANVKLLPSVCGYRDCASAYQLEYRRRLGLSQYFGERSSYVLLMDIARFAQTIDRKILERANWMSPQMLRLLAALETRIGRYFLPGDHWGCRLGTMILSDFDADFLARLRLPWLRWLDDIHIFAPSERVASDTLGGAARELRLRGFALNDAKTRLLPAAEYLKQFATSPRQVEGMDFRTTWNEGLAHGDRQKLRYAVRRLAYANDPTALTTCVLAVKSFPDLLPRVVHYLAAFPDEPVTASAFAQVASQQQDDFTTAWLLAAAVAKPAVERLLDQEVVRRGAGSDVSAVRALAWRLERRHGRPTPKVPDRFEHWAARRGDDFGDLPVIDSNI